MIRNKEEWFASIREASLQPSSAIEQKDGRWKVIDRVAAWKEAAPKIFDDYLDRFERIATRIFSEKDPQFELDSAQRFMARAQGKTLSHSTSLRKGMAETLALLGTFPQYLTSVTHGKATATAAAVVRNVLGKADSITWASVNDYLPMFAEAAPEQFLDAVEESLEAEPSPFVDVFAQEAAGIMGHNYLTGLLWALETLAWSRDYLTRAVELLGALAAIDPGGNWTNRPFNSLVDILLPWHPQTIADVSKRVAAVGVLVREQPAVAWRLLLSLLPEAQTITSGTRKPTWRKFIPEGWSDTVTNKDYWDQIRAYANIALELAKLDQSRLVEFVKRIVSIPNPGRAELLKYLQSADVTGLSEDKRRPIWEELVKLASVHRQYSDAEWAIDPASIEELESVAKLLEPQSAPVRYHRLFGGLEFELYEERGDYAVEDRKLQTKREQAIEEILKGGGIDKVFVFSKSVDAPSKVGDALGSIGPDSIDSEILPTLLKDDEYKDFVGSFIGSRIRSRGWTWTQTLRTGDWSREQQLQFLLMLPFTKEAWELAVKLLKKDVGLYWQAVRPNVYNVADDDVIRATELLLSNGRPRVAIQCLARLTFRKQHVDPALVVRALNDAVVTEDKQTPFDHHGVRQLIKWLQDNPNTPPNDLSVIEWRYLALLDRLYGNVTAKTLQRSLAQDPKFFCEVIRAVFRSDKQERKEDVDEARRKIAQNGYRLLREWTISPGTTSENNWDAIAFREWLSAVKQSTLETGHFAVAMSQVGHVLPYAPADPSGLWIHKSVAEALNAKDAAEMRSGFTIKLFNMRGAHSFTHGHEEQEIAKGLREKADAVENATYQRFANALRDLAKSYERDAEREALRNPLGE